MTDFSGLDSDDTWSFKNIKRSDTSYITHSYHRYPAKFIPQIVQKCIKEFTNPGDLVLDPFGGCGTTLVESKVLGRKSIGFDINPVAKFITDVKTRPIDIFKLDNSYTKFKEITKKKVINKHIVHSERTKYWFDPKTLKQLDKIYQDILQIKDVHIRKFYLCAFSQILKNSSKWLMKSTKPQIDPNKKTREVLPIYIKHLKGMINKNYEFYSILEKNNNLRISSKMKLLDSTKKFPLATNSVDMIVTSPPYVTSYEYADLHQLTLHWFGDDVIRYPRWKRYVENYSKFRSNFVGTQYILENSNIDLLSKEAIYIVRNLNINKNKKVKSIYKYFLDMQQSFKEMYRVLRSNGYICIIIGNTEIGGVNIKNAEATTEQLLNLGFNIKQVVKRELSNKMITSWRDKSNGKFSNKNKRGSKRIYNYEFVIIGQKI